jgi:isopentenyl diphosphate isomerase/L-lactate dehydrogenase-like FMN-dependent dehydrogenase
MDIYQNAGVGGIIVTVDQQASYYERTQQDRNFGGRVARAAGAEAAATATGSARYRINGFRLWYTWQYIDAMRKMVKGPLVIKGILDPQDARLAIEHGADAIIVSNHGGRSMDYGPSTLEVLPEIVAAVNGRIPVIFDSGIRRGADIFKALALGANAVMLGRTTRWGLAAFGTAGAQRLIEILQQELVQTAAAAGCARLSDINKTTVKANFV